MTFTENLCKTLKQYQNVIIYGFADIGTCVLDYIINLETNIKIANYSGRVKYFATSFQNRQSKRIEKKGIKIKSIYDLTEYSQDALVIVATQEIHHQAITQILDELNFQNRIYVLHEDYCMLREIVENHQWLCNIKIGQYHLNHQMKLALLKEKLKNGKKIKVFFMTHDASVFGAASVYREMEKDDLFDPYIYVVSRRDVTYEQFFEDVKKDVDFFEKEGYNTICGYDDFQNPKDLHTFSPDIIFYDIPKLYGPAGSFYNRLEHLNWEYLTCYIPYGMYMVDSFYYHYHTTCIRETWKFFLDTNNSFKRVLSDGEFNGFNTVFSGYPKFDDYYRETASDLPTKIDNGNPIVIYAPHHSLGVSNNFATFDLYGEKILKLAQENPQINFVFKPHPLLKFQIRTRYKENIINISPQDYDNYCERWESLPNAVCVSEGDYIQLFQKSCCMITDCGSFIGEYFPSKHPCIYIFNPRKNRQEEVYTPLATQILDTYYVTKTEDELDQAICEIILKRNDHKKEKREALFRSEFSHIGHAGEYIYRYLKEVITL